MSEPLKPRIRRKICVTLSDVEIGGLSRAMVALEMEIEPLTSKSDYPPELRRDCEGADRAFKKIHAAWNTRATEERT